MIMNRKPYPISFEREMSQALVCRYGEEMRQYVFKPDIDVSGLSCLLQIAKTDGTFTENGVEVHTDPDTGECTLVITIPQQATVVKGLNRYSICVYGPIEGEDHLLYSAEGPLWVDDDLITDEMIASVAEVNGLVFPRDFLTVENLVDIVNYVKAQIIDDQAVNTTQTWSSSKINNSFDNVNNSVVNLSNTINAMKTGFDGVVYNSPAAQVIGSDEALQGEIDDIKSAIQMTDSVNKWNPADQAVNKIVSNQTASLGELTDQNGYTTSGFISASVNDVVRWDFSNSEVQEGDPLSTSANGYRIAEYDSSKTCLYVTASWISLPYTIQNNDTAFIRVSVTSKAINSIMINSAVSGSVLYIPYGADSQRIIDVETELENAEKALTYRTHSRNWFDKAKATIFDEGTVKMYLTDYIPVTAGEILYASKSFSNYSNNTLTVESFYLIRCYDMAKNEVGNSGYWKTSYTIPSGTAYVKCYVGNINYAKIMIEKDTQTLSWEPYWVEGYISNDPIARANVFEIKNSFLYSSVNMFDRIGAIGDSYTAGYAKASDGSYNTNKAHSYLGVMAKRAGIDYAVYGQSGATTRSYIVDKLPEVLADNTCDFYFLALGINDVGLGLSYIGSVSDIHDEDYTLNADTFYGNYGKIIAQVQAHAPKALFVLIKVPLCGTNVLAFDDAIDGIGEHYGIPVINPYDDDFFKTAVYEDMNDGHPTLRGYTGMGLAYERLLSKAVYANPTYFKFATIG